MTFARLHRFVPALLLLVLCGCAPAEKRADLVFVQSAEPETIDPALVTDQVSMRVSEELFEGLCRFNERGEPEPAVAERWDVSADKKRYTFHLRANARWSNGEQVTAQDFVYSWRRVLEPKLAADYATLLYVVKGGREINNDQQATLAMHAPDARTLEVELVNPVPYFIDLCALTTLAPVHRATLEQHGTAWIKPANIVCNGAYQMESWRLDDRIRLRRNPLYWDAAHVPLETVDVRPMPESNTALTSFATGETDLLMDKGMVPPSLAMTLKQKPWFHTGPFLGTWFMSFNTTKPPFNDPRVRQAFALAIDKKSITEKITRLGEPVADSLVPPGAGQNYRPPPGLGYDVERARKLLAEAGFAGGKGLPRVEFLHTPLPIERSIAVELQAIWKENLGVEVGLVKQEQKVWLDSMRTLNYTMCRNSWVGDYNDPSTFLEMFTTGNGNNRTGFASPQYDQRINDAAAEADPKRRELIMQTAEHELISEATAIVPVYYYVGVQFYHAERLQGVQANYVDVHPFRCMRWK